MSNIKSNIFKKISLFILVASQIVLSARLVVLYYSFSSFNLILSILFLLALSATAFLFSKTKKFIISYTVFFAIAFALICILRCLIDYDISILVRIALAILPMLYISPLQPLAFPLSKALNLNDTSYIIMVFVVPYIIALSSHLIGKKFKDKI